MAKILIDGETLTRDALYRIVYEAEEVQLAPAAREKMLASRAVIERLIASDAAVYGVNTGFGKMASVRISREQIGTLQVNLVRSHACGVGAPLSEAETRAMLVLRANAIAKGFSGVRPVVAETLCAMLNKSVHPVIPGQGSVGASGDLAPLAHLAMVAIGEGDAIYNGDLTTGAEAMKAAGIAPLTLEAKEGLAMLNGTQGMLSLLSLALRDAEIVADTADVAAALSLDALRGSPAAFDARIAKVRPYPGHATTARNLDRLNDRQRDPRLAQIGRRRPARAGCVQLALHPAGTRQRARRSRPDRCDTSRRTQQRHGQSARVRHGRERRRRCAERRQFSRAAARDRGGRNGRGAHHARWHLRAPHRADDQSADEPVARVSGERRRASIRAS